MFFLKELPSRQTLERYSVRYPDLDVGNLEDALIMMRRASVLVRELEKYFDARGLSFRQDVLGDQRVKLQGLPIVRTLSLKRSVSCQKW